MPKFIFASLIIFCTLSSQLSALESKGHGGVETRFRSLSVPALPRESDVFQSQRQLISPRAKATLPMTDQEQIFSAIRNGKLSALKQIHRRKQIYFDSRGWTPLYAAVFYGHPGLVEELLLRGENVNRSNRSEFKLQNNSPRKVDGQLIASGSAMLFPKSNYVSSSPRGIDGSLSGDTTNFDMQSDSAIFPPPLEKPGSSTSPKDSPRRQQLKLLNLAHRDVAAIYYDDGTPIFALARKPIIRPIDAVIAQRLLDHSVQFDQTDATGKTVIDLLVERIARLSIESVINKKPRPSIYNAAMNLYLDALDDPELFFTIQRDWLLFASSQTTASIINELSETNRNAKADPMVFSSVLKVKKHSRRKYLGTQQPFPIAQLITWKLDITLPPPHVAVDVFHNSKKWLPPKDQFSMLLNYLLAYGQLPKDEKQESPLTISDIETMGPYRVVARSLFELHRALFIEIDPRAIAIKIVQGTTDKKLHTFLEQMRLLPHVIERSIITSRRPEKKVAYWKKVALKLHKLGDLYGVFCVRSALNSPNVKLVINVELSDIPDLQNPQVYTHEMNERKNQTTILSLIHEIGSMERLVEAKLLNVKPHDFFGKEEHRLQEMLHVVINHVKDKQRTLKRHKKDHPDSSTELAKSIVAYFRNLPNVNEQGNYLLALNRAQAMKREQRENAPVEGLAESWDTRSLFNWLQESRLLHHVPTLVDQGIVDGPTLLEKYAVSESKRFRELSQLLFASFRHYQERCTDECTTPLQNLNTRPLPARLYEFPASSFEWLTWLRNNRLFDAIKPLTNARIDTFKAFIDAHRLYGESFFTKVIAVNPDAELALNDLARLAERFNRGLVSIEKWQFDDVRSWLLGRDLSHIMPAMFADNITTADDFLALIYVYQKLKVRGITLYGVNNDWFGRVNEAMSKEYKITKRRLRLLEWSSEISPEQWNSRFFFIRTLHHLNKPKLLASFLEQKIFTLSDLQTMLHISVHSDGALPTDSILNPISLDPILARYGFEDPQIEILKTLFSQQTL